jgi:hypothetical protein
VWVPCIETQMGVVRGPLIVVALKGVPHLPTKVGLPIARRPGQNHRDRVRGPPIETLQEYILHRVLELDRRHLLTSSRSLNLFVIHVVVTGDWAVVTEKL